MNPDFSTTEPKAAEHRFLPSCEVRSETRQASGHLERPHSEVGTGGVPAIEQAIGEVVGHGGILADSPLVH